MNVYKQFGVEPIINASGTVTRLGGALMSPEVVQAFKEAAQVSVSLDQLQAAASRHVAKLTDTEAGLITAGCAASLTLGTAAMLAGMDLKRMEALPHATDFPNEIIIAREHRSGYDHSIRAAGAKLVEVGFNEIVSNAGVRRTEAWEYENAIGPNVAGIVYVHGPHSSPPLKDVVEVAHRYKLPVLVDAAGELPPRENLKLIPGRGADLVAFSGGKGIRGPQSTGILCGRTELIQSAALQMLDMDDHFGLWDPPANFIDKSKLPGIPRHGIGRGFKVSKEEIIALLTALDLFVSGNQDDLVSQQQQMLMKINNALENHPVDCVLQESPDSERSPILFLRIDENESANNAFEICRRLREGTPSVHVGHGRLSEGILVINPVCLREQDVDSLIIAIQREL